MKILFDVNDSENKRSLDFNVLLDDAVSMTIENLAQMFLKTNFEDKRGKDLCDLDK